MACIVSDFASLNQWLNPRGHPFYTTFYIIIINRCETININPVDLSSRYILYSYRDKACGTLSQMSAMFESTYIGPCLQFFGRNPGPGWSPMTDTQVFYAPWGSSIMTDLLVVKFCSSPSSHVLFICWPKRSQKPRQVKIQDHSNKPKWISTKWGGCLLWNPDDQNLGQ